MGIHFLSGHGQRMSGGGHDAIPRAPVQEEPPGRSEKVPVHRPLASLQPDSVICLLPPHPL